MADDLPFPLASAEEAERDPGSRPTEGSPEGRKAGSPSFGFFSWRSKKRNSAPGTNSRHQTRRAGRRLKPPSRAQSKRSALRRMFCLRRLIWRAAAARRDRPTIGLLVMADGFLPLSPPSIADWHGDFGEDCLRPQAEFRSRRDNREAQGTRRAGDGVALGMKGELAKQFPFPVSGAEPA
ncbi:hypothetical protein SAMN05660284_00847 [Formivibrio citricus]|uniref:Uncharacterized protein n=1 Tax=Formivibrio citricus TaxID=83765 RepID=A0A1I4X2D3_9NEIS|nr:hypothetical protein SAMN05660284_00847 [Formivibrio citricus]